MTFDQWWEFSGRFAVDPERTRDVAELAWKAALESDEGDDDLFRQFWQIYPRRVGKPAAEKKFNRLKKSEQMAILDHLPKRQWPGDKQYIPHPATFLNQRRWEDEDQPTTVEAQDDIF